MKKQDENEEIGSSQRMGIAPMTVALLDESIDDVERIWDFGDGFFSVIDNPVYTYNVPGTYSVTLTVAGSCGSSSRTEVDYIRVLPRTTLPTDLPPQPVPESMVSPGAPARAFDVAASGAGGL